MTSTLELSRRSGGEITTTGRGLIEPQPTEYLDERSGIDLLENGGVVRIFREERRGETTATRAVERRDEGDEIGSESEHGQREIKEQLHVNEHRSERYAN